MAKSHPSLHESMLTMRFCVWALPWGLMEKEAAMVHPTPSFACVSSGDFYDRPKPFCTYSQPQAVPHSSPLMLPPCSQPQSSPQVQHLKPEPQHSVPACTSSLASWAGDYTGHLWWFLSILSATKQLLHSPPSLRSSLSAPADLHAGEGAFSLLTSSPGCRSYPDSLSFPLTIS